MWVGVNFSKKQNFSAAGNGIEKKFTSRAEQNFENENST